MSWKDPSDRHNEDLIEAIGKASHRIATAITQGFAHMADAQTKALGDLQAALTSIADAIAGEIAALQSALASSGQPDDSGEIEQAVTNLNNLTASLKSSIPAATGAKPAVTSITPTSGPAAGGTSVMLAGTGFTGATGVTVGGGAATAVAVLSDTSLSFVTPSGTGSAAVVVSGPNGTNAAVTNFSYV